MLEFILYNQYYKRNILLSKGMYTVIKRISIKLFLCIFIVLILPGCTGCRNSKIKGPAIRFEKEIYNFGEVVEGQDALYSFSFSNPGTELVIIADLHLSCWCVVVEECDRIVKPGGQGNISGIIKTEGFLGDIAKTIRVESNIPDIEPILSIEGKILAKAE